MARKAYENGDASQQQDKVLGIQEQLKEAYKHDVGFAANAISEVESKFAPSHLFFSDKDLGYSWSIPDGGAEYVFEFVEGDDRAPYRGFYKRTEVGRMFPTLLKADDRSPDPTKPLVTPRGYPPSIYQDESAALEDGHLRNLVDGKMFDLTDRFLNAEGYFRITTALFGAMIGGNASINKLIVDTFLSAIAGIGSYPHGNELYPFFCSDDSYTPDDGFSKNARGFYLKDGEIRKRLTEFRKHILKYYKARYAYMTNINAHEYTNTTKLSAAVPKWNERIADKSDAAKTLSYVREAFFNKDSGQKYTQIAYSLRRQSVDALTGAIEHVVRKMMKRERSNGCGHEFGKENKQNEAYTLQCEPENLMVFMHEDDLRDAFLIKGSYAQGPFTESMPVRENIIRLMGMGVRFYGVDFLLPSMAIVIDRMAFSIKEYFNEVYEQFFPYDLVTSKVSHVFKKLCLYRIAACNVIELAKGHKFAVPLGGGSQMLPFLREQ